MFNWKRKRTPNNPRRILVIGQANLASTTGGSITVFFHFCRFLVELGHEVTGACYGEDPTRPASLDERVRFVNACLLYPDRPDYSTAINRLVGEMDPDLIVFFFPHYYLDARLEKRFNDIPRILMFHSRPDFLFAQRPKFEKSLRRHYVNTVSQVLLDSYRDRLPDYMRQGQVVVIANGIRQFSETVDYSVERKKMVYFSRIDRLKGVDLLIETMALVKEKHPDWSIDIFGDIEPLEYRDELQAAIQEKGLQNQVFLKGKSPLGLEETLKAYDFCFFPSRVEGFSVGLGETLSVGLPCIGLRSCSGVNEVIIDGYNGLLCEDSPEDLAKAINRLIENPQEREKMGRCAHTWIQQYAPLIIDMQWARVIRSLLDEHKNEVADAQSLLTRHLG